MVGRNLKFSGLELLSAVITFGIALLVSVEQAQPPSVASEIIALMLVLLWLSWLGEVKIRRGLLAGRPRRRVMREALMFWLVPAVLGYAVARVLLLTVFG